MASKYWNNELKKVDKIIEKGGEELLDRFIEAHDDYQEYLYRDDGISYTQENEDVVNEIYFNLRNAILEHLCEGD